MSKLVIRLAAAAGLSLAAGAALATALPLVPGASGSVPVYDGRTPTTTTLLDATCGYFSGAACSIGTSTADLESTGSEILDSAGGFIEVAGTTALNPYGSSDVALAFIIGGQDTSQVNSATLSSLGGYMTSVEACGPIFGSAFAGCSPTAGMAARSSGTGSSVTFSSLGLNPILGFPATDGYVVYTNAPTSALTDPDNFSVMLGTTQISFAGFGLTAPAMAPEISPASALTSLTLLAGCLLVMRSRRRLGAGKA